MTFKILVTGKNRKIASDTCEHLEEDRGYHTIKCPPKKSAIFEMTLAEMPKVVIICLGDETAETIKAYNVLSDAVRRRDCAVIVITNNEDEKLFMKYTEITKFSLLSRPVPLLALFERIGELEERFNEKRDEHESAFRDIDNADAGFKRKQILVVDDDTEQLISIKESLSEFYDVTPVKSGEAAYKYLSKHSVDLILLDYIMPGEDGPTVLKNLQETEDLCDIPVIFLTGVKDRDRVLATIAELMPAGYVIKPSKKSELVAKIIEVLG